MTHGIRAGIVSLMLVCGVIGCGSGSYTPAPAPSVVVVTPAAPPPTAPTAFPPGTLTAVRLSGLVYEMTATGPIPIADVPVYCELCGRSTHNWAYTNARGIYEFPSNPDQGGGIWLSPNVVTQLWIARQGYDDPPGLPPLHGPVMSGTGWREVLINGDTQFDVLLVRR